MPIKTIMIVRKGDPHHSFHQVQRHYPLITNKNPSKTNVRGTFATTSATVIYIFLSRMILYRIGYSSDKGVLPNPEPPN